jgi:phosphatidylethanolamine N-methyltransferase
MATLSYEDISNQFGWSFNEQFSTLNQIIDFSERRFIDTMLYSILCMILWTVLPHIQFKFNLLSKLVGDDHGKAADFLAYIIIYSGCSRNYAFNEAINNNFKVDFGDWNYLLLSIGYALIVFGLIIVAGSFYRLGLRGMYFGDYFGFLFKEKIVSFPYNTFENPQYIGTCAFFTGLSITHLSPTGLFLTLFINITYSFLNYFESSKLAIFYPNTPNTENAQKTS